MTEAQFSFSQDLLEKLIPSARKPVSDITLTMLAPDLDMAQKARLKMELQKCWAQCSQRIDHRQLCEQAVEINFAKQTHYIAKAAMEEFNRQRKLYNEYFTVGLKSRVDYFAQEYKKEEQQRRIDVFGWRLGSSNISDFRRRNGERLLLVSHVDVTHDLGRLPAKTSNISKGGCLLLVEPDAAVALVLYSKVVVEYCELAAKYALDEQSITYEVVDIKPGTDACRVALKRIEFDEGSQFDKLVDGLMNEHKRRNRLDVDNTIRALSARCHSMASIAQLNSLIVMSHRAHRYHLLISQGHTISLQAELLLSDELIPHMSEETAIGGSKLFFVWANSRDEVYIADLKSMAEQYAFDSTLKVWRSASWHKAFLVKAEPVDAKMADLGTTIPSTVSKVAEKLNAPLPARVEQFTKELGKLTLMEDVTYIMDSVTSSFAAGHLSAEALSTFRLPKAQGRLRQTPFDVRELPKFYGHYRFSHECELEHRGQRFTIVNGHANALDAVLALSLKNHKLEKGSKVKITWSVEQTRISLDARVVDNDTLHKRLKIEWLQVPGAVKQLFQELDNLNAFDAAFKEDVNHNKLDVALRNITLSNLPKVAVFAQAKKSAISLTALTGHQHLPKCFIDGSNRVRLDGLFNEQILKKLALSNDCHKEILIVAIDGGKVTERRLLSEFSSPKLMLKVLQHLFSTARVYIFAMDITRSRHTADDAVIAIENKYLRHYSPGKAKKLEAALSFNMAVQLTDISKMFEDFILCCA